MFREMRRKNQALSAEECEEILARHGVGVLACVGDDGYPYAVPVNYVYVDGKLVIHGGKAGHRWDAVHRSDKVSFCVIDEDTPLPEVYSTAYKSVIVFGRARVLESPAEMQPYLEALTAHFVTAPKEEQLSYIRRGIAHVSLLMIEPEHVTGKKGSHVK